MSPPLRRARCVVDGDLVAADGGGEGRTLDAELRRIPGERGGAIRRMHRRDRAAALAAAVALERSGLDAIPPGGTDRVFLWVATERGSEEADAAFWGTARDEGGLLASPALFAATLPSSLAGEVARVLGLAGPAMVTAGVPGRGLEAEALEAAVGTADLLLLLVVGGGPAPRVEAVAIPAGGGNRG